MAAAWAVARNLLRRRRATTVVLTVLVGVAGGTVIAAVAGASRTDSAMRRFVAYSRPQDLVVVVNGPQVLHPSDADIARTIATRERVQHLPQVADAGRAPYLLMAGNRRGTDVGELNVFAAADTSALHTFERPRLLQGRFARPQRSDEAVVDDVTAAQRHLHVGSRVQLWSFSPTQGGDPSVTAFAKYPTPRGAAYGVRIVGITRLPTTVDAPPASATDAAFYLGVGAMHVTPAFLERYARDQRQPEEGLPGMEMVHVRLRRGARDLPAFERAVGRLVTPGDGQVQIGSDTQDAALKADHAIHLESIALLLFAVLAGLAAVLVLGQVLARLVAADAEDHATLAALGMTSRALVVVTVVRAGIVAIGGAAIAVVVAVLASPLTPIGLARRAEIHPGISVNTAVLALGFAGVVVITMVRALVPAVRAARRREAREVAIPGRGGLRGFVARSGLGPAALAGVSMSFERRAIAFRTALLAALVAVAGVTAAATFGLSLRHLVDTPRQQGWTWDVVVGNSNSDALAGDPHAVVLHRQMTTLLARNRVVAAYAGLARGTGIVVDGQPVNLGAIERLRGSVFVPIVRGRAPRDATEIALGRDTLRQLHRRIGDTVTVRAPSLQARMRVVGESLLPTAGDMSPKLSSGGVVTIAGLRRVLRDEPDLQFAVRYRRGVDRSAAFDSLLRDFGREVLRPYPGGEVGDLARVDFLPAVLAALLVVLATGALVLMLLGSVRAHRRDLAVLRTLGFVRRQLTATVAWQATVLALTALVVGIPCGIVLGRLTWRAVAGGVGSVSPALVPVAAISLFIPVTLFVANLLAVAPGWTAARGRPAPVLRAE